MAATKWERTDLRKFARKVMQGDAAMSAVLASVGAVAVAVAILGTVWFGNQVWQVARVDIAVEPIAIANSGPEGMNGDDPAMGQNGVVGDDGISPGEYLSLTTVGLTEAVTDVIDDVGDLATDAMDSVRQKGDHSGGKVGGPGGESTRGTLWGGGGVIPPQQRWAITYTGTQTLEGYANLLDYFHIELGVMRGNRLSCYSDLASSSPKATTGGANEDRLYFAWKDGGRIEADKQLLKKSHVLTDGAIIVHFYPKALETQLLALERQFRNRQIKEIRNTKFSIRQAGRGYEFHVTEQIYNLE